MSPERVPRTFGRTRLQTLRGTLLFVVLGMGCVAALTRFAIQPQTPLGAAFRATGLPPQAPLVIGGGILLLLAGWATVHASRTAESFRLDERGLEVRGWLGSYCLEWANIVDVGTVQGGSLGVRVRSREAVIGTHSGTAEQLQWLRTQEPYGAWDYLFTRADLGTSAETVRGWMQAYLGAENPDGG